MSENCSHNCQGCTENCAERKQAPQKVAVGPGSNIKKVVAVVSGKGGVGKSLITSLLAVLARRKGYEAAILDADLTGPSIPKVFGHRERVQTGEFGILPVTTSSGIRILSINSLLENETDPVLWRGPMIAGTLCQLWSQTEWGDIDYLFVDMPPGTGDVPLTVFQSLPVDGIIVVTSPQELVGMIVAKAINMAKTMNIPLLGIVENMSWFECPKCGERYSLFGESRVEEAAKEAGIDTTARLPMDPTIASLCDAGRIETFKGDWLDPIVSRLEKMN